VHLDARPLRHPATKAIIRLPLTKLNLAHAVALEWDLLTSAQQATKQHFVPLTSLVSRALDIRDDDAAFESRGALAGSKIAPGDDGAGSVLAGFAPIRSGIAETLLRYLDTDSLLCWAPPPNAADSGSDLGRSSTSSPPSASLRDIQESTAIPILQHLTTHIWPGITLEPVLDEGSIIPKGQKPGVREVVQGWILGLPYWELAGLERAVLAGKGLLGAVRLVVEWSEAGLNGVVDAGGRAANMGASTNESLDEDVEAPLRGVSEEVKAEAYDWTSREAGLVSQRSGETSGQPRQLEALGGQSGKEMETAQTDAGKKATSRFGVEEAAQAASLEVDWQTKRWGEVEDTHDVDKEDLRRQLGSVVLLVSGAKPE
jgi:ATP synthase mitochondrial F1 complex assembly factor 2